MMVIYVPGFGVFHRAPFTGCFADLGGSRSNWIVPGTWPEWML